MRNLNITSQNAIHPLPVMGILTHVAELAHHDMIYIYHKLQKGTKLTVQKDEDRFWDNDALAVYFGGFKLGYISKKTSGMIQRLIKEGSVINATVKGLSKEKFKPLSELDIEVHVMP